MEKLYFVRTLGYNMMVSETDGIFRYITDSEADLMIREGHEKADALHILLTVEDDSSWEILENITSIDDVVNDGEILAIVDWDIL